VRVAFVGKGGAGKSSLAGTFSRLLAGTGERVLALDSDPMPGLAFALGVDRVDHGLPDEVVEEDDTGGRFRLATGLRGVDVVERHAVRAPDGVYLLQLGKARGQQWKNTRQHFGFQGVLDDLPDRGWSIVGDLPGGTRQPFMTWGRWAETFIVVVEPTPASLLSARRLAGLAAMPGAPRVVAIANKVREPADVAWVGQRTGLTVLASVGFDPALATADRLGSALLDTDPEGPTAAALRCLVDTLRTDEEPS